MKIVVGVDCKECKYGGIQFKEKNTLKVLCNIDDKSRCYGQFLDCHFKEKKDDLNEDAE